MPRFQLYYQLALVTWSLIRNGVCRGELRSAFAFAINQCKLLGLRQSDLYQNVQFVVTKCLNLRPHIFVDSVRFTSGSDLFNFESDQDGGQVRISVTWVFPLLYNSQPQPTKTRKRAIHSALLNRTVHVCPPLAGAADITSRQTKELYGSAWLRKPLIIQSIPWNPYSSK